jgi:hypothetical protein
MFKNQAIIGNLTEETNVVTVSESFMISLLKRITTRVTLNERKSRLRDEITAASTPEELDEVITFEAIYTDMCKQLLPHPASKEATKVVGKIDLAKYDC